MLPLPPPETISYSSSKLSLFPNISFTWGWKKVFSSPSFFPLSLGNVKAELNERGRWDEGGGRKGGKGGGLPADAWYQEQGGKAAANRDRQAEMPVWLFSKPDCLKQNFCDENFLNGQKQGLFYNALFNVCLLDTVCGSTNLKTWQPCRQELQGAYTEPPCASSFLSNSFSSCLAPPFFSSSSQMSFRCLNKTGRSHMSSFSSSSSSRWERERYQTEEESST